MAALGPAICCGVIIPVMVVIPILSNVPCSELPTKLAGLARITAQISSVISPVSDPTYVSLSSPISTAWAISIMHAHKNNEYLCEYISVHADSTVSQMVPRVLTQTITARVIGVRNKAWKARSAVDIKL